MAEIPVTVVYIVTEGEQPSVAATIPQLPGVITQGATIEEARENLFDALACIIEAHEDRLKRVIDEWQSTGSPVHIVQGSITLTIP